MGFRGLIALRKQDGHILCNDTKILRQDSIQDFLTNPPADRDGGQDFNRTVQASSSELYPCVISKFLSLVSFNSRMGHLHKRGGVRAKHAIFVFSGSKKLSEENEM